MLTDKARDWLRTGHVKKVLQEERSTTLSKKVFFRRRGAFFQASCSVVFLYFNVEEHGDRKDRSVRREYQHFALWYS